MTCNGTFLDAEDQCRVRAAFDAEVRRIAGGLRASGLGQGETVAVLMRNDLALVQMLVACDVAGLYCVPLNWHAKADEVSYVLVDSDARLLVAHTDLLDALDLPLPASLPVIVVETPPSIQRTYGTSAIACAGRWRTANRCTGWQEWLGSQAPLAQPSTFSRGAIIYTSGTTGRPKGVQRAPAPSAQAVASQYQALHAAFGTRPGMRAALVGPLYHGGPSAYWRAAYAATAHEGFVLVRSKFEAQELLSLIERHRITHIYMVPTMFVRLMQLPEATRRLYDVSSIEHIVHTAAPCPVEVKAAMTEWFGDAIFEFYGTTETGPVTIATPADARSRPGTVGRIMDGVELRILGSNGEPVGPGEQGEVVCRNTAYSDFTYRHLPAERAALDRNGLVATGDVGYLDHDGYLFICDRIKDMVISGGVNIYPAEIEAALLQVPGVRDCAVFGIPDPEFGEALAAHVQLQPGAGLDPSSIRNALKDRLASYKVPRVIQFDDELPRQDNGKIYKRRLSAPYWENARRAKS